MLSDTQKKAIFVAVLKSYTIATKSFTAATIYNNQVMSSSNYPYILLNYINEEDIEQNAVGEYLGTPGSHGQRSIAILSVNIYAKAAQDLNANQIANEIARLFSVDIHQNWKSLSSGTVKFRSKSATRNLTGVEQAAGILDIARRQMDIRLAYDHVF